MFWLYLRRNHHYYFVRNIVFSAMALALIGYVLFPTAPPRMLTDLGFIDTLEKTRLTAPKSEKIEELYAGPLSLALGVLVLALLAGETVFMRVPA